MLTSKERYTQLVELLTNYNAAYYSGQPVVTDAEYDTLYRELAALEKEHPEFTVTWSPTQRVGAEPKIPGLKEVQHVPPMLSLDNMYSPEDLGKFFATCSDTDEFVVEPKVDGLSIRLVYENGVLILAATRGDGHKGEDVTRAARAISAIPTRILSAPQGIVEIRGEVFMTVPTLDRLNAERKAVGQPLFANPRNAAVGTLKSKDVQEIHNRSLSFLGYRVIFHSEPREERQDAALALLSKWQVPVVPHLWATKATLDSSVSHMDEMRKAFNYWTDGVVIKASRPELRKKLGEKTKYVAWAAAAKYGTKEVVTKLNSITVQVGPSGALTPVAELEPVVINGTTVARATLHNFNEVARKGVKPGMSVKVVKAGEIIPEVIGPADEQTEDIEKLASVTAPEFCPECGGEVVIEASTLYCTNNDCPGQLRGRLIRWCSKEAMDIDGCGDALARCIYDLNRCDIGKLYALAKTADAQILRDSVGEQVANNFFANVEASKSRGLERLLFSLSIPGVGKGTAKRLVAAGFDLRKPMTVEELEQVKDIGPTTAKSIVDWTSSLTNVELILKLQTYGVNMEPAKKEAPTSNKLEGTTVVVTGTFAFGSRDEVHALIEKHGGKTSGSVSKKTTYVVHGEDAGSKLEKAKTLGVKTMTEAEFISFLAT